MYIRSMAAQTSGDVATKDGTSASASDITWNGKTYSYTEHLSNFLFLGIDTKEKAETKTGQADAGQADALYLLSWNRLEGDITVISIPRDTMTQIETFLSKRKSLERAKISILALAHTVTADMKAVSWRKMQFPESFRANRR